MQTRCKPNFPRPPRPGGRKKGEQITGIPARLRPIVIPHGDGSPQVRV